MTYKGVICRSIDEKVRLVILDELGYRFIPITDDKNTYGELSPSMGSVCAIKFYDGTELVTYEFAIDKYMVDIFIVIEDLTVVSSPHESLYDAVKDDYEEALGLWEVMDELFLN